MTLLKALLDPLVLLVGAIVLLEFMHWKKGARGWGLLLLRGVAAVVLVAALPVASTPLARAMEAGCPMVATPGAVDAVLVLGAGYGRRDDGGRAQPPVEGMARLMQGLRVAQQVPAARLVLLGGSAAGQSEAESEVMGRIAQDLGFRPHLMEAISRNTHEHRVQLQRAGFTSSHLALVTSASHMRRALAEFSGQKGFSRITPVSVGCVTRGPLRARDWVPSTRALQRSATAIYEFVGGLWYEWRRR